MLMLAIGSYLFGLLLIVFRIDKNSPQEVPFWITAKILQGTGTLMLYHRISAYDGLAMLANTVLLLGCAYEAWAVRFYRAACKTPASFYNICWYYTGMFNNSIYRKALSIGINLSYPKRILFFAEFIYVQKV